VRRPNRQSPDQAPPTSTARSRPRGRHDILRRRAEALNEHILGNPWPAAHVRLEMLAEAVDVIRALWGGGMVERRHYTVENARIYTLPEEPPPIIVFGFRADGRRRRRRASATATAPRCPTQSSLIDAEQVAAAVPRGPDLERHAAALEEYAEAGFDERYVQQIGGRREEFFEVFVRDVLPRFA
jgi:alkanesulfonate monooxygenase SsuD/methylene tetrahydromethanopterin reductase-like flavin-dependent oxidoreductase (luciferase family)